MKVSLLHSCGFFVVVVCLFCLGFSLGGGEHLFYVVWRAGMRPILAPHDGRCQFGLIGIRTCDHLHPSPELYHCSSGADNARLICIVSLGIYVRVLIPCDLRIVNWITRLAIV